MYGMVVMREARGSVWRILKQHIIIIILLWMVTFIIKEYRCLTMEGSSKNRERGVTGLWPRRLAIDLAWGRNSRSERWLCESLESGDPKGKLSRMRSKTKVEHGTQFGLFLDLLNLGPFQISVWWHITREQRREVWSGGKDSGVDMQPAEGMRAQFCREGSGPQRSRENSGAGTAYVQGELDVCMVTHYSRKTLSSRI